MLAQAQEEALDFFGIDKDTEASELKKKYRAQLKENHPDSNGNTPEEKEVFAKKVMLIVHNYKILTDPSYTYRDPKKNEPFVVHIKVPLDQAVFGVTNTVNYRFTQFTTRADGEEKLTTDIPVVKTVDILKFQSFSPIKRRKKLKFGSSIQEIYHIYEVEIPPQFGDFCNQNENLCLARDIPVMTALIGGSIEVTTLWGLKTLVVPPGTKAGTQFKIPNCGFEGKPLILKIREILFPSIQELKSDPTYEALNIKWGKPETEEDISTAKDQEAAMRHIK